MTANIDYTQYFLDIENHKNDKNDKMIAKSLSDRRMFVSLFYQYRLSKQQYLVKAKLFFEKYFIVDLANEIGRKIFEDSYFESKTSNFLYNHVKPGDTFIDCGAAEGYYSFIAAHKLQGRGKVIAYEMNSDICEIFQMNNAESSNVKLHQVALTGDGRDIDFNYYGRAYSPYSTITDMPRFEEGVVKPVKVHVTSTTLSHVLNQETSEARTQEVIWIKIDLEGAEYEVLQSSIDIIAKRNCKLIIEIGFNESMTKDLVQLLLESGMKLFEIGLRGCTPAQSWNNFDFVSVRNILAQRP